MHKFFSALVTGTGQQPTPPPPPHHPTNSVGRVHAEFRVSTLYTVGVVGGGEGDCKVFSKN